MKITVLGSGSTGNAVLICTEKTKILVDAGMSAKQILERVAAVGELRTNIRTTRAVCACF
jgi:phosphoribosyl 1,2-cyclic phosphodiesterase